MEPSETPPAAARAQGGQDDAEMFEVQQLRAMEQPQWNEARLDDLNEKVEKGFEKVDERLEKVDDELKGMQRLMVQGTIAISSSMVVGFAAMATVMVAKL